MTPGDTRGGPPQRARIRAVAGYVPPRILSNAELEKLVDTSDEWIVTRTGIRERHLVEPGTPTSELATRAGRRVLEAAGVAADELDLIIVATVTPDMAFPPTACLVQDRLKASRAWAFDLSGACCGFLYALTVGAQFIAAGAHRRVLVIGADIMSILTDYTDRGTCILFGDGAGAVLLEPSDDDSGIVDYLHESDGAWASLISLPAGGSAQPTSQATLDAKLHTIRMNGQPVFKYATRKMHDVPRRLLERNGLAAADLALYLAHQANARIIEAAADRLGVPREKVLINIDRFGNTTAATIPLAFCTALAEGRLAPGDWVMVTAVGAGFTVGAALLRWSAAASQSRVPPGELIES
jgi:3-oxoacyl-[acyl-carrier-protein] synthase-3